MIRRPTLLVATLAALAAIPAARAAGPGPVDDGVRVAVLGYHDFSETEPETEMRIRTSSFRRQLETIRQLGLNVISMDDFAKWKRGEHSIPDKSVVITIDDGWKSVHDEAFPVLREFGYPFTIFLYKNYVDGGGRALSSAMIREMQEHGATIGSHSVSHPFPATVKGKRKEGPDAFDKFLRVEMGESKRFLESRFGQRVTTYAYPGGYLTREMFPLAGEFGYEHLFTVLPGKVRRSSDDLSLPRYIVLATHPPSFERAVEFPDAPGRNADHAAPATVAAPAVPHPVTPRTRCRHRLAATDDLRRPLRGHRARPGVAGDEGRRPRHRPGALGRGRRDPQLDPRPALPLLHLPRSRRVEGPRRRGHRHPAELELPHRYRSRLRPDRPRRLTPCFPASPTPSTRPSATSAGSGRSPRRTSRTRCARSASRCSRPTSSSASPRTSSPASRTRRWAADVLKSIKPGEQVVKIFHDELAELLGGDQSPLDLDPPARILLCGLNGAGKTTTSGQARATAEARGPQAPADRLRPLPPAAIEQLATLGKQVDVPVYTPDPGETDVVKVAGDALKWAETQSGSVLIFDTAGRQELDDRSDRGTQAPPRLPRAPGDPAGRRRRHRPGCGLGRLPLRRGRRRSPASC